MRMPISFRRRATMYDITPYSPIVAISAASAPKKPDSVAISRSRISESRTIDGSVLELHDDVAVRPGRPIDVTCARDRRQRRGRAHHHLQERIRLVLPATRRRTRAA